MFIHGVGVAYPERSLSNDDSAALGITLSPNHTDTVRRCGVVSQAVSLPFEYIQATGNVDVLEAWKVATHTPTGLGVEAARHAMSQAGLPIESIGLVVADTATPYQTCPSEAQRIAGEFGVKIPAYDVVGGVGAIPHCLAMFASWREDRVPEYALCISTNTPLQHVCFSRDPLSASLFGDAAVALVVSKKHTSPVRVVDVELVHEPKARSPIVVEGMLSLSEGELLTKGELTDFVSSEVKRINRSSYPIDAATKVIPPQLYAAEATEILSDLGIVPSQVVTAVRQRGFALGSSYGMALAETWETLSRGGRVVILHCGDGMRGSVTLGA
jgi:3-oxoacyl-[acyl-carrier-protein] synthase III